jgi:regulator of protease activity HflC (stomatin/prohibitin superfamily)
VTAPTPLGNSAGQGQKETEPAAAPMAPDLSPLPASAKAGGVSLIGAQIVVQYRVTDLGAYVRCSQEPAKLLNDLAERAMTTYFAQRDIDTLLLQARLLACDQLRAAMQQAFDAAATGVVVQAVDMSGVHPPSEVKVAEAFLAQVAARQKAQAAIDTARQKAVSTLASAAGTADLGQKIKDALDRMEQLKDGLKQASSVAAPGAGTAADLALHQQEKLVRDLVEAAQGEAGKTLASARVERWDRSLGERGAAKLFEAQLLAYHAAPHYFLAWQRADLLATLPPEARKYIIDVDPSIHPIWQIDMKDELSPMGSLLPSAQ